MGSVHSHPINRVMLIFPPLIDVRYLVETNVCVPMGIAYLGAYIRDIVEVQLLDCVVEGYQRRVPVNFEMVQVGLGEDDILERIRRYAPDLVGLSCIFSSQYAIIQTLAGRIKEEISSDILLVTGGTHPSFLPEKTLTETAIDYVVLGEGEPGLRALITAHNTGAAVDDIDGVAFRKKGEICVNPKTVWISDLDTIPFPARDLLPMERYFAINLPMALHWRRRRNTSIISSRGCPYACPFCSSHRHWGNRYRKRSVANILSEIRHLRDNWRVRELKWQDDNLTVEKERAAAIFRGMIEQGLIMPWNTPNGIALWTLDEDLLRLMKQSGCYEITLAVESGDETSFARYVRKPFTLEKAREVAALARKTGITTVAYFISGFPGETLTQIRNSMRFALELRVDYIGPFVYNPLPGSDLWQICLEQGYISEAYAYGEANNFFTGEGTLCAEQDQAEIYRLKAIAYLGNLLLLPFRNPREFFAWYGRRLLTFPRFIGNFFMSLWLYRSLLRQALKGGAWFRMIRL